MEVQVKGGMGPKASERPAIRSEVVEWSRKSRGRMLKTLNALDWDQLRPLLWLGLTYPAQYPEGLESKQDLKAFKERWRRQYGSPKGAWKMEFQRRGAPHYHLLLKHPPGHQVEEVRVWVAEAWYQACGKTDDKHLLAGTSCEAWRSDKSPASYFAGYGSQSSKEYQQEAPTGTKPGRYWGIWGIKPQWVEVELPRSAWIRLRRTIRRVRESRRLKDGRRVKLRRKGSLAGGWCVIQGAERLWRQGIE